MVRRQEPRHLFGQGLQAPRAAGVLRPGTEQVFQHLVVDPDAPGQPGPPHLDGGQAGGRLGGDQEAEARIRPAHLDEPRELLRVQNPQFVQGARGRLPGGVLDRGRLGLAEQRDLLSASGRFPPTRLRRHEGLARVRPQ